jgi:hypothetical protein
MVYFQTEFPKLGKFWRVLQWNILVYFSAIWYIVLPLCIFYCHLVCVIVILVYFIAIWYILMPFVICVGHLDIYLFSRFGILYQEKSGNRS